MEYKKKADKLPGQVGGKAKRERRHFAPGIEHQYGNAGDDNLVRLQMYKLPPTEMLGLMDFEEYALERLKILKAVERVGVTQIKGSVEYQQQLKSELEKINKIYVSGKREYYDEFARKDILSHYILRLAYCKTEDLRRWLIMTECDYFRYRFLNEFNDSPTLLSEFLKFNELKFESVSEAEKLRFSSELKNSSHFHGAASSSEFYKVPFTDVLDLVRKRSVFIHRGCAFVSQADLVSIIIGIFRSNLSQMLTKASRFGYKVDMDERLRPILQNLPRRHLGKRYDEKSGALDNLSAAMIPSLNRSFPPCMQKLYSSLREHHHLKHHGRQQYWNFLKGIGMPMEETIHHVREEFTKMMDPDKFDKEHRYNIRHSYGHEGKKTNYSPFSCMKIITSNQPGPGDFHGCPFKHTDPTLLKQRLASGANRITDNAAKTIVEFSKDNHFQVACSCYFEAVHDIELKTGGIAINHPNQYFKDSQMRLHPERFDKKNLASQGDSGFQPQVKKEITSTSTQIEAEPKQESLKSEIKDELLNLDDFEIDM